MSQSKTSGVSILGALLAGAAGLFVVTTLGSRLLSPNEEPSTRAEEAELEKWRIERQWEQQQERQRRLADPDYAREQSLMRIRAELDDMGYCIEEQDAFDVQALSDLASRFSDDTGVPDIDFATASPDELEAFASQIRLAGPNWPKEVEESASRYNRYTIPWRDAASAIEGCWHLESSGREYPSPEFMSIWAYERGIEFSEGQSFVEVNRGPNFAHHTSRLLASPRGVQPYGLVGIRYASFIYERLDDGRLKTSNVSCNPVWEAEYYEKIGCPK